MVPSNRGSTAYALTIRTNTILDLSVYEVGTAGSGGDNSLTPMISGITSASGMVEGATSIGGTWSEHSTYFVETHP